MSSTHEKLNRQFSSDFVSFHSGNGGLICARVNTIHCVGEIYLHGAHVTAYQPVGHDPVLWMSKSSCFESGKPIRGGVPLCFPWFGPNANDSTLPIHGYVRSKVWDVVAVGTTSDGGVKLELATELSPFQLRFSVTFAESLDMELQVTLPMQGNQIANYEAALHTYLSVGDIRQIEICGLEDCQYADKVGQIVQRAATRSAIRFHGETDRIYQDTKTTCTLIDAVMKRRVEVSKWGSDSTVIWNPWIDKSRRMPDFGDDEWPEMVCIETANILPNQIKLEPGQTRKMRTRIVVTRD